MVIQFLLGANVVYTSEQPIVPHVGTSVTVGDTNGRVVHVHYGYFSTTFEKDQVKVTVVLE